MVVAGAGVVVALSGWSDSEPVPNIGGLSNSPNPGNEFLTLRRADGAFVDIVNFDDDGIVWPADAPAANPGQGTAWSIYLLPGHYSAADDDNGQNWEASVQGIDLALLNTATAIYNGFDIGSPGLLAGVVTTQTCSSAPCYANCDGSTTSPVLNLLDFSCFLNRFAANDPYANCDGRTTPPTLNILGFSCFLNQFATGCP